MTLAASLRALAEAPDFESSLIALADDITLTDEGRERLTRFAARKRWALLGLADAISDAASEEDLYRCLASAWLELRFAWQRANMVLNYQSVRHGDSDQTMLVIAAAVANVLGRVEELLNADDRERWSSFAVDLIAGASADLSSRWGDESISLSPIS
jgi:hypothetical protein